MEIAKSQINQKTGREIVFGTYSPLFGFEKDEALSLEIVERILDCNPSVLAIGVDAPKQEKGLFCYKDRMPNVKIFMAIGAMIEWGVGTLARTPKWLSEMGLEWLYRLFMETKRLWKRYLIGDIPFLPLILLQKLGLYKDSSIAVQVSHSTL